MTSFKLAFRFERRNHNHDDNQYKLQLKGLLDGIEATTTRIYTPSLNSIKVLFPTEAELNKVMDNKAFIEHHGFTPRLSMALKSSRTVFCFGLDPGMVSTYSVNDMEDLLQAKGWDVVQIYIMRSKTALKI